MTENYIPSCVTCPKASCTRSNICARYAEYQKAKVESDTFKVLNPERLKLDGASCPYCLVAEKQLWVRGASAFTIPSLLVVPIVFISTVLIRLMGSPAKVCGYA